MQTLPPTSLGLVTGCIILLGLVVMAALGVGASSRVIGLHLPHVARSKSTWVGGHRAALWIVVPCCVSALALAVAPEEELAGLGWLVWGGGVVGGALVAMLRARRLLRAEADRD